MSLAVCLVTLAAAHLARGQHVKLDSYRLANGMEVILHEDHTLPMVSVNILYRVGSKDEPPRRSGFAHLFEHLMFMGTDRVPTGQYDGIMEGGGGWNNADTTEDRTDFYDVGPSNLLPTLLWLEADRLETLGKNMTQSKLDLQRNVVKNERRQNTENTPYGRAYEAINGLMFPAGHPYHTSVIGSMEDLDNASVQDVQEFFATYYVPNNASMVIAGDFSATAIRPIIARLFGSLPRANDVARKSVPDPRFPGVKRLTYVDEVDVAKVILAWHAPAIYHPGDAEMNLAGGILSDGIASRLYQRLVVHDKLATDVSASVDDRLLGSLFLVDATAAKGASLDRLEAAIREELARLSTSGPTANELSRQVAKTQFQLVDGLQSVQGTADQLNEFDYFMGRPDGFSTLLSAYRSVTPADFRAWFSRTITPSGYLDLRVVPDSPVQAGPNPRAARPSVAPPAPFTAQQPRTFRLKSGLKVEYWQREGLPLMSLSLRSLRGADLDRPSESGLAQLTMGMLDQGAGALDGIAFHSALDSIGAQFSASASMRSAEADLSVLSDKFEPALKLFASAVRTPRFEPPAFERVRRIALAGISEADSDPDSVATRVANRAFFGDDHPYGRPPEGVAATVRSLTLGELKAEKEELLNPATDILYAAGSLPEGVVQKELESAFSGWTVAHRASARAYGQPPSQRARVLIVDRPGAVQTVVKFLFPAPVYSSPDRQALTSMAVALGGSFTSRLNHNLREDKGYTYGASARYVATPSLGYLVAGADVRADVTGASLKEFLSEFARISGGDISPAEAAKVGLTRRQDMVSGLDRLQGVLSAAAQLDENLESFASFEDELRGASSVSAESMNRVARTALPMDQMLLVLVGDKSTILRQLAGLGLPAPEIVSR